MGAPMAAATRTVSIGARHLVKTSQGRSCAGAARNAGDEPPARSRTCLMRHFVLLSSGNGSFRTNLSLVQPRQRKGIVMLPHIALALISAGSPAVGEELPPGAIRVFGEAHRPSWFSSCDGPGVFAVAISPDGALIATGESDELRVWDVETGEVVQRHPNRSTVHAVRFSHDGTRLAWGGFGNSFALVDVATGRELLEPDVGICVGFFASFSADDRRLLSDGSGSRGHRSDEALLWDLESGERIGRFSTPGQLRCGVLTPDGGTAITGDNRGRVLFWDADNGRKLGEVRVDASSVLDLSIDATGSTVAAVSSHPVPYVAIIDVERREERRRISRDEVIRAVALSADGRLVAMAGNERGIDVHDAATGVLVQELVGHRDGCSSLMFHPDGSALLSGGFHGSAVLWEIDRSALRDPE